MTENRKTKLIVALDVSTLGRAEELVSMLYPTVKAFKIGSQLFTAYGPEAVEMVGEKGAEVFLDLKFHDIPNTVYLAARSATDLKYDLPSGDGKGWPVFMLTVHTKGGEWMLRQAVAGSKERAEELGIKKPLIVGVTVLTSDEDTKDTKESVLYGALLARKNGLEGIVCSVNEAGIVREELGPDFIIITPGIRPEGSAKDDQARIATPRRAVAVGANYIVVGRPIIQADNPLSAAKEIIKDLEG